MPNILYITYIKKDGTKPIKDTLTANTPRKIHELIGKYLAKQFSGEIKILEYTYLRG